MSVYLPALFVDDGDAEHAEGEYYLGVGSEWPAYISGELPGDFEALGLELGWNVLASSAGGDISTVGDIDANPLAVSLVPDDEVTLSGTYAGDVNDARLALFPVEFTEDVGTLRFDASLLYDEALAETFDIAISGPPPDDHMFVTAWPGGGPEVEGAMESPFAYGDLDGSESYTEGDALGQVLCFEEDMVNLLYLPGFDDLSLAWSWSAQGLGMGWLGFKATVDEGGGGEIDWASRVLTDEEATQLMVSLTCGG